MHSNITLSLQYYYQLILQLVCILHTQQATMHIHTTVASMHTTPRVRARSMHNCYCAYHPTMHNQLLQGSILIEVDSDIDSLIRPVLNINATTLVLFTAGKKERDAMSFFGTQETQPKGPDPLFAGTDGIAQYQSSHGQLLTVSRRLDSLTTRPWRLSCLLRSLYGGSLSVTRHRNAEEFC